MDRKILKDMIKQQDLTIGLFQQIVDPDVTENLALAGFDYIILDLEHTGKTIESAYPCIMAAYGRDVPMLVRVTEKAQWLIEQALDAGAQGVIVPTVETVEDCELIIKSARYAPEGERGMCPVIPASRWMNNYCSETYTKDANRDIFVGVLVETPLGIKNLPEMLKVDGIDAFLLGSGDLSIRLGKSMWDPEVKEIIANAMNQITAAGKISVPIGLLSNISDLHKNGAKMVMLGMNDPMAIQQRMGEELEGMREIVRDLAKE